MPFMLFCRSAEDEKQVWWQTFSISQSTPIALSLSKDWVHEAVREAQVERGANEQHCVGWTH